MMTRAMLIGMVALAACGRFRDPEPAPILAIEDGSYTASLSSGCASLSFGRRDQVSYGLDADCDGSAEASGDGIVTDNVITLGDAVVVVTAVGPESFSGDWQQGGASEPVRFTRVAR